jgi:hypothetical protein
MPGAAQAAHDEEVNMGFDDFEDLLELSSGGHGKPCLVQLGRALHKDGATTGYAWSSGRIGATVSKGWVRIRRRLGVMGRGNEGDNDLRLDRDELRALLVACEDWAKRRNDWAAFYSSGSGHPPGFGCSTTWYQPPGKNAKRVRLGERTFGRPRGEELLGRDELVPLVPEGKLAVSVLVEADIWRRGEKHGPAEGSLVGARYRLGGEAVFIAERGGAEVQCRGRTVHLEPGEEEFVAALLEATA